MKLELSPGNVHLPLGDLSRDEGRDLQRAARPEDQGEGQAFHHHFIVQLILIVQRVYFLFILLITTMYRVQSREESLGNSLK